jgi:hypothetical protein
MTLRKLNYALAVGVCVVIAAILLKPSRQVSMLQYQRIAIGMSKLQVESIVGRPGDVKPDRRALDALATRAASFGGPTPIGDHKDGAWQPGATLIHWYGDAGIISVALNQDSVVIWKYFVALPPTSCFARIKDCWWDVLDAAAMAVDP